MNLSVTRLALYAILALVGTIAATAPQPLISGIGYRADFGTQRSAAAIVFPATGATATIAFDVTCQTIPPTNGPHGCPMLPSDPPFVVTTQPGCTAFAIDGGRPMQPASEHVVEAVSAGSCELTARATSDPRLTPITIPISVAGAPGSRSASP